MSASTGETELAAKRRPNTMVVQCLVLHDLSGEVVEWFMALVLKTSVGASPPSVRIRPSPLLSPVTDWAFLCLTDFSGQLHCFQSENIVASCVDAAHRCSQLPL